MFEVKFGTPKPVPFKEYAGCGDKVTDVDLEVRFVGKCEVSEYDNSRYADDEAVSMFIKSNCCEILERCLKNRPEKESIVRTYFSGLDETFSTELKNNGITAKTEILLKNLTEESERKYKELQRIVSVLPTNSGWDHVNFDSVTPRPEGTYMVSPVSFGYKYKDDRLYYKPGERVEVDYCAVASDTSYQVTVLAPDVKVEYGSVIHISFTMPEHDVYISIGAESVMTCLPNNSGMIRFSAGDTSE